MTKGPLVVIAGSGSIADDHVAALQSLGIPCGGVYSPTLANAQAFGEKWSVPAFDSVDALLATGATHLHICAPTGRHAELVTAALLKGIVPVCEKPLSTDGPTAQRLADLATELSLPAYLTFNRRFDGGVRALRAAIAAGRLGEPVAIYGTYQQDNNVAPLRLNWRHRPAEIGPSRVLSEIGSHWLDLAEHLLDRPLTEVNAYMHTAGPRDGYDGGVRTTVTPPNEDMVGAFLRYGSQVVGQLYATQLAHAAFDDLWIRVDGTEGSGEWRSGTPELATFFTKGEAPQVEGTDAPSSSIRLSLEEIYKGADTPRIGATFADGVRNCVTMDAIIASSFSQRWEKLEHSPTAA